MAETPNHNDSLIDKSMKYFWKPILMACILLGVLTSCSDNGEDVVDMLPKLRPISLTVEQQQMRDNNNEFACRLFRTINEQKDGNGSIYHSTEKGQHAHSCSFLCAFRTMGKIAVRIFDI